MTLVMEIMKTIAMPIGELALWLEETYQVSINDTITKWAELTGMNITVHENIVSHDAVESVTVETAKNAKSKKIPKTKETCQHTFLSGQKVGEQCTTKPKNGALFCSAHKPKDSVKSVKKETPKKKPKEVVQIGSEFASDSEEEPCKKQTAKGKKDVISENDAVSEPEEPKKVEEPKKASKKKKAKNVEKSDDALSELEEVVAKPLLKKAKAKNSKKSYNTDDELVDKDLNLSDEE